MNAREADGTVTLYPAYGKWAADARCGRCLAGRYFRPERKEFTQGVAALWLNHHYKIKHPDWHRLPRTAEQES